MCSSLMFFLFVLLLLPFLHPSSLAYIHLIEYTYRHGYLSIKQIETEAVCYTLSLYTSISRNIKIVHR